MHPRRSRHSMLPRLMALLLIAAGLLLHPMAESMGALHETVMHPALHAGGGHAHLAGDGQAPIPGNDAPAALAGDGLPAADPDPLHALLHFAHCCAAAGALPAAPAVVTACVDTGGSLQASTAQAIDQRWLRGPFRPPIAA